MAALPPEEADSADNSVFQKAVPLSNSEVALVLEHVVNTKKDKDPNWQTNQIFRKTQEYVERFHSGKNPDALTEMVRQLEQAGIAGYEKALVINLQPQGGDEALTLIPSLRDRFQVEDLDALLMDLEKYKAFE